MKMDCYRRDIIRGKEKVGTGCEELDQCLQGGFSTKEICEISGTAFMFLSKYMDEVDKR